MTCSNGGCRRPAAFEIHTGYRVTDWRPVCGGCAEALQTLYPEQRPIPGVPAWVARMDRNAKPLRAA